MRLLVLSILCSAFILTSCGTKSNSEKNAAQTEENSAAESVSAENAILDENGGDIKLIPFGESPSYDNAIIESLEYKDGNFTYTIPEGEYKLGEQTSDADIKMCANSAKGQHIHLIIDDQPYYSFYTPTFEKTIMNGKHYILTFLSRSYHESIKTPDAHRAMQVEVKDNNFASVAPINQPMIFYSRPKGTYVGDDTKKVMLDFYPIKAELGKDAYKVKVDINNKASFTLTEWQPYYIVGLPMGVNNITLSLIDSDGELVDSPLNKVSRRIVLKADPAKQ